METTSNPYAPPTSDLANSSQDVCRPISVYTPFQVGLASFLGGPLAAIYTLSRNYHQLEKSKDSQNVIIFGAMIVLFLIWLSAILPPQASRTGIPLLCTLIATNLAKSTQLTKAQVDGSQRYKRSSSWNVALVCVASIILFFVIAIPCVWLLEYLNIASPA